MKGCEFSLGWFSCLLPVVFEVTWVFFHFFWGTVGSCVPWETKKGLAFRFFSMKDTLFGLVTRGTPQFPGFVSKRYSCVLGSIASGRYDVAHEERLLLPRSTGLLSFESEGLGACGEGGASGRRQSGSASL